MGHLDDKHIAVLATEGVEQIELTEPRKAVEEAGARTTLVSLEAGEFQGFEHLDKADTFTADKAVADCSADDFDGLIIPGGVANGDFLRADEDAVRFVRAFFDQGKPVASICHGPWILAEADVVRGRKMTSWPSLRTDLRNAGAEWVDEEVVVDEGLVTSRKPDDLPAFCAKAVEEFAEGRHEGQKPGGDRDERLQQETASGHA
jgi:protease I